MTPQELQSAAMSLIASARAKAANGLTAEEFGSIAIDLIRLSCEGLDSIDSMSGADKKAWALAALAALFDTVSPSLVPVWLKPAWFIVGPTVRSAVIAASAGALEVVLKLVRRKQTDQLPPTAA